MTNPEKYPTSDDNQFEEMMSSLDLGGYEQFDRVDQSRDKFENHNEMAMNLLTRLTIDYDETSIDDAESMLLNGTYYMYEYANELSKSGGSYVDRQNVIAEYIYRKNASKINELSDVMDLKKPFAEIMSKQEIIDTMDSIKVDCGGDLPVVAARVYRGLEAYMFNKFCAEAFGIGR